MLERRPDEHTDGATIVDYRAGDVAGRDLDQLPALRHAGPCVIVVHGGGPAAQNLHRLAEALAGRFTVCVPDRRGRGRSGTGDTYGLDAETDDLIALVQGTGAVHLFGLSSGGLIVLFAARGLPDISSVAVFEPLLSINHSTPLGWVSRHVKELATGDLVAAAVTATAVPAPRAWYGGWCPSGSSLWR